MINNFSQTGLGFSIDWGGTGTFLGPKPGFDVAAVQAFECDKTIIFTNESEANTDSIVSYLWNFGAGANPTFDTTAGPLSVVYESFGDKKVALTVMSEKGCVVTEIIDFYVEPCCKDTSTLAVTAFVQDEICPGIPSGYIQGIGISGSPDYQFSLDCENFQPATVFPFLTPGTYTLCVEDQKGCRSQVDVEVLPAPPFQVEAGDTVVVNLGESAQLNAIPIPILPNTVTWNNPQYIIEPGNTIQEQLRPTILPPMSGWYVVTVTSDVGCTALDSVLVIVDPYKPIFIPNVITPNSDHVNDEATVYGNVAATLVLSLQIFDRWGGMLWENTNFELNDPSLGWDGTSNNKPVAPGVYAYAAKVAFLDGIPGFYNGTITVIR